MLKSIVISVALSKRSCLTINPVGKPMHIPIVKYC